MKKTRSTSSCGTIRQTGTTWTGLRQGAAARGISVPVVVQKRPELRPDAIFYWNAYLDLMEADWVACERYARVYNVDVQFLWKLFGSIAVCTCCRDEEK